MAELAIAVAAISTGAAMGLSPAQAQTPTPSPVAYEPTPAYRDYVVQFAPRDKLFPWSARRLEYMLEDIGKLAGIPKRLSFDMCRWTCAVREARAGTDFDRIRQKLGLSKVQWREIGMKLKKLTEPAL